MLGLVSTIHPVSYVFCHTHQRVALFPLCPQFKILHLQLSRDLSANINVPVLKWTSKIFPNHDEQRKEQMLMLVALNNMCKYLFLTNIISLIFILVKFFCFFSVQVINELYVLTTFHQSRCIQIIFVKWVYYILKTLRRAVYFQWVT